MNHIYSKDNFLKELRKHLLWKYNKSEIIDIMADYEEYFDIGLSKGKGEKELCEELGTPMEIVGNLKSESASILKSIPPFVLIRIITLILLLSIALYWVITMKYNSNMVLAVSILLPIAVIGIWFLLGGELFSLPWFSSGSSKKIPSSIFIIHIGHVIVTGLYIWFMKYGVLEWVKVNSLFSLELHEIGPFITTILLITMLIMVLGILYWLRHFRNKSIYYYSLIVHELGIIGMIMCFKNILHRLSDISLYQYYINLSFIPYIIGGILTVVSLIYCRRLVKR